MTNASNELRKVKAFTDLVDYLQEKLDWPLGNYGFEELTFEYSPEELGLRDEDAAKIKNGRIYQLRPLQGEMPWGIFFVEFEKKKLPVVVVRRILGSLAIKKRASANKSEHVAFQARDLLFVTSFGTTEHPEIAFAHFHHNPASPSDLPTLRVLGWDDQDTVAKLDKLSRDMQSLKWPDDPTNDKAWREQWSKPFRLRPGQVVKTTKDLATVLAQFSIKVRNRVEQLLAKEHDKGPLQRLLAAMREGLIHDMSETQFADMFAQTVAYGLLLQRFGRSYTTVGGLLQLVVGNEFLRDLLEQFLHRTGRRGGLDFDEAGIQEIVDFLDSPDVIIDDILRDFNQLNPLEDPVIHFYEYYLAAYNPKERKKRGVYYTPRPVVSYIVRSVHELLQTEFGLEDGLASTVTWKEFCATHPDVKIPDGTDPNSHFVTVLDPATGTATFLYECIEVIERTMKGRWARELKRSKPDEPSTWDDAEILARWRAYVPQYLIPRLYGFEIQMAPYTIAQLKLALKLGDTGYQFKEGDRLRLYLTNSLEPASTVANPKLANLFESLAHEAQAVNEVKRNQRFTVVIGNPPYSILSQNLTEANRSIIDVYKSVQGIPIKERGALQFEKLLQDDYVKFLRYCEIQIERASVGVNGLITNHSFVDNPTMRGVRDHLMATFPALSVLDLHGNSLKGEQCPDGSDDRNVFDIKQGVAILIGLRGGPTHNCLVRHSDLWGERSLKYSFLASKSVANTPFTPVRPSLPYFLFTSQDESLAQEYRSFPALSEMMPQYSAGVITARDNLAIDESEPALLERAEVFRHSTSSDESLCDQLDISLKKGWDISTARKRLREEKDIRRFVRPIVYRVFDTRRIFYHPSFVWGMAFPTMKHMLSGKNIAIITVRRVPSTADCSYFFVSRSLISNGAIRMDNQSVDTMFPLYLTADKDGHQGQFDYGGKCNFSGDFIRRLATLLGLSVTPKTLLPVGLAPEDIFQYAYAVFHSPDYRSRYAEFLKIDFPRLPLTANLELFRALAGFGGELVALHLLESRKLDRPTTELVGGRNPEVEKVSWSKNTVWLDKAQTTGFKGVPEDVWNFYIGGYQVCEKWLKDRKGRTLSKDDIVHYQKIVVALSETIRLMKEIDEVIDKHGGWPGAFQGSEKV